MANVSYVVEFDNKNKTGDHASELETEFGFPSEFPYEFESFAVEHIQPPVESVAGSTETESSDEEEFFAGLTRRMSQTSLHQTLPNQLAVPISNCNKTEVQNEVHAHSGSPLSTLSGIGLWSGQSPLSSNGSPTGSSRVPSPNTTPFSNDAWDAINAAAERVAKLKMNSELSNFEFQNRRVRNGFSATPFFTYHNLNHTPQIHQLKEQRSSLWVKDANPTFSTYQQQLHFKNKSCTHWNESVKCTYQLAQPQWHHLKVNPYNQHVQQRSGYGSKSVINDGSGVKKSCAGTGVFLPRRYATPHEPCKKTKTAKVTPAVNFNIDHLNSVAQQRFANASGADYNALLVRHNAILMQQMLNLRREEAKSYEMRLPQEWTY